jgi:hypothetical protein
MTLSRFRWTTYDVRTLMPDNWESAVLSAAAELATSKTLLTRHSTSREARADLALRAEGVSGRPLSERLPWLRRLYETTFRDLAQLTTIEPVSIMGDPQFGIVLNVQRGSDRYECHIDTNPIEGLLYCTSHPEGSGGELVVSNHGDVSSVQEVDADATIVEPKAGYLVFFDGRHHAHYVRQLRNQDSLRVVAAMNFYVPSCPEASRPKDLNLHLDGTLAIKAQRRRNELPP